jgi:hypothetical protein
MESVKKVWGIVQHGDQAEVISQRELVFRQLIQSLTKDQPIKLSILDELSHEDCKLALQAVLDWRIARHYAHRL